METHFWRQPQLAIQGPVSFSTSILGSVFSPGGCCLDLTENFLFLVDLGLLFLTWDVDYLFLTLHFIYCSHDFRLALNLLGLDIRLDGLGFIASSGDLLWTSNTKTLSHHLDNSLLLYQIVTAFFCLCVC